MPESGSPSKKDVNDLPQDGISSESTSEKHFSDAESEIFLSPELMPPSSPRGKSPEAKKEIPAAKKADDIIQMLQTGVPIKNNYELLEFELKNILASYIALDIAEPILIENGLRFSSDQNTVIACAGVFCLQNSERTEEQVKKEFTEILAAWKKLLDDVAKLPAVQQSPLKDKAVELKFALQDSKQGHFTILSITIGQDKKIVIQAENTLAGANPDLKCIQDAVNGVFKPEDVSVIPAGNDKTQKDAVSCGFHVAQKLATIFADPDENKRTPSEKEIISAKDVPALRLATVKRLCEIHNKAEGVVEADKILPADVTSDKDGAITLKSNAPAQASAPITPTSTPTVVHTAEKSLFNNKPDDAEVIKKTITEIFNDAQTKKLSEAFNASFKEFKLEIKKKKDDSADITVDADPAKKSCVINMEATVKKLSNSAEEKVDITLTRKELNNATVEWTCKSESKLGSMSEAHLYILIAQQSLALRKKQNDPNTNPAEIMIVDIGDKSTKSPKTICGKSVDLTDKEAMIIKAYLQAGYERVVYKGSNGIEHDFDTKASIAVAASVKTQEAPVRTPKDSVAENSSGSFRIFSKWCGYQAKKTKSGNEPPKLTK